MNVMNINTALTSKEKWSDERVLRTLKDYVKLRRETKAAGRKAFDELLELQQQLGYRNQGKGFSIGPYVPSAFWDIKGLLAYDPVFTSRWLLAQNRWYRAQETSRQVKEGLRLLQKEWERRLSMKEGGFGNKHGVPPTYPWLPWPPSRKPHPRETSPRQSIYNVLEKGPAFPHDVLLRAKYHFHESRPQILSTEMDHMIQEGVAFLNSDLMLELRR